MHRAKWVISPIILVCIVGIWTSAAVAGTVEVDVTRQREINGQLSIVRKNLFNVHAGASSFSDEQQQYLFEDLDVFAGRGFGVLYKMKQIPEDANRPGYWDAATMDQEITSASNKWVSAGRAAHDNTTDLIITSHTDTHYPSADDITAALPNGFRTRDHDANAEFISKHLQTFYPRRSWYEFSNEINGEADELQTTWADISTLCKTIADRVHDDVSGVNFVGFGGKWPAFERNDFGIWNRDWVEFIDVAGASMDAYSIHLYSRMGANAAAIMDMINNYSMISIGETRPLMITECGHLTDEGTFAERLWQNMRGQNMYFLQFLERGGLMERSIPFNTSSNTSWPSAMLEASPTSGEMVWTDMIKLYEFWQDFKGERIESSSSNPQVLTHAVQDGSVVRVVFHNFAATNTAVDLSFAFGNTTVLSADQSRMYWDESKTGLILNESWDPDETNLQMSAYETVMLTFNLSKEPASQTVDQQVSYYGAEMIQAVSADVPVVVHINDLDLSKTMIKARLRLTAGNLLDWMPSSLTVNGYAVAMPENQLATSEELRAYVVDIPSAILQSNNTVEVRYAKSGGQVAGAVMDVTYGASVLADYDGDSLPDQWEVTYGLNPVDNTDASADLDEDGFTNAEEYICNTSPADADDYLSIFAESNSSAPFCLRIDSRTNRFYSVQVSTDLLEDWSAWSNSIPGTGSWLELLDTSNFTNRFYKVDVTK